MSNAIASQVTACMLTYNHVHLIESTVQSVLQQSVDGYNLLISDDCSSDGTWAKLQELAAKDARIRIVQTPNNMGMAANANFAVEQVSRPFVALLHHDDICRNDLIEKWASALDRHSAASFVFNSYAVEGDDRLYREEMPGELIDGDWLLRNFLLSRWDCAIRGTAMIRRDAWTAVGGMRTEFGMLADIDLWMRLARCGPVAYVDAPLIVVRQDRPEDYPDAYKGNKWSWSRLATLYEIHARNRREGKYRSSMQRVLAWWTFRIRLNLETAKWMSYAVVRGRNDMIATSPEGATDYDLLAVKLYRRLLLRWTKAA